MLPPALGGARGKDGRCEGSGVPELSYENKVRQGVCGQRDPQVTCAEGDTPFLGHRMILVADSRRGTELEQGGSLVLTNRKQGVFL